MDERGSRSQKSRPPRNTLIINDSDSLLEDLQCPLRKGIIYYCRGDAIFERNIHTSNKREPRIIANLQPTEMANSSQIVPIKHNRMLVIGKGLKGNFVHRNGRGSTKLHYLHLSIHEICSYRVGPALWTYHDYGHSNIFELQLMKSANTLGITLAVDSKTHMKLFDIVTEEDYPLIEAGRLNYNRQLVDTVVLSPDRRILLEADGDNETINIFYSGSGDTNNMDFSFATQVLIPNSNNAKRKPATLPGPPSLAFSVDGSKFATATLDGVVSVWDVRSKILLKVFRVEVPRYIREWPINFIQFSSGILGREALVFMEHDVSGYKIIHVIDATSFETEEFLCIPNKAKYFRDYRGTNTVFCDPSGGSLYTSLEGILYEWDLWKNEDPEFWLGEE